MVVVLAEIFSNLRNPFSLAHQNAHAQDHIPEEEEGSGGPYKAGVCQDVGASGLCQDQEVVEEGTGVGREGRSLPRNAPAR